MSVQPSKEQFRELARGGGVVPVHRTILADQETPISLYRKLASGNGPAFLLESVEGSSRLARYSFLGSDPFWTWESRGSRVEIREGGRLRVMCGNPWDLLRREMQEFSPVVPPGMPPFWGGPVGYWSYDMVQHLENLPPGPDAGDGLPDSLLLAPRVVLALDHLTHGLQVIVNVPLGRDPEADYAAAVRRLDRVCRQLQTPVPEDGAGLTEAENTGGRGNRAISDPAAHRNPVTSNLDRRGFTRRVEKVQEYIRAGDAFQVVLSQRLETPAPAPPLAVYRLLRNSNPSPYLFFLDFGSVQLAGASPEPLVRLRGSQVQTRPIAGTRPRGDTPERDRELEADLRADAKERAEHTMLVDLGRNDLGRVCRYGTVTVPDFMRTERFSRVMHLVSDVEGELSPGRDALDALAACFPAGTVSGAPKVRALEIIAELEPTRRGPYAGAVGYLGFSGDLDTCIAIRTVIFAGGQARVQAGAGIVADSHPEREYEETLAKADALLRALARAREVAL